MENILNKTSIGILNKLPPSWQNNSRDIVKRRLDSFKRSPSESKAKQIEGQLDDVSCDFLDNQNDFTFRGEQIPR